jgi:hypothetical protein
MKYDDGIERGIADIPPIWKGCKGCQYESDKTYCRMGVNMYGVKKYCKYREWQDKELK